MSTEVRSPRTQQNSTATFLAAVLDGLSSGPNQKSLPSRYFYDERGCELFEQICTLAEYYPTRTELDIMRRDAESMAAVCGEACMLIELGSGSSTKTRLLLDALRNPAMYVPVEIAPEYVFPSVKRLRRQYPELSIEPVCADFTQPFGLPETDRAKRKVVYFPGSTIGNFHRHESVELLAKMRQICAGPGGMLIGMDLVKGTELLEAAYNDDLGVTAEFNLNLLERMRRELDADIEIDQFEHLARYNERLGRIEIYLRSTADQTIQIAEREFTMAEGELINTEYSYKYNLSGAQQIAAEASCSLTHAWLDKKNWFGVFFFEF